MESKNLLSHFNHNKEDQIDDDPTDRAKLKMEALQLVTDALNKLITQESYMIL